MTKCFSCKKELPIGDYPQISSSISRSETCPHCLSDVRCCSNCNFFDPSSYNECRENSAERVVEKDRSNFCDYFSLKSDSNSDNKINAKEKQLSALDNLFKK